MTDSKSPMVEAMERAYALLLNGPGDCDDDHNEVVRAVARVIDPDGNPEEKFHWTTWRSARRIPMDRGTSSMVYRCRDCGVPVPDGDDPDPDHNPECATGYTMTPVPYCAVCGVDLELGTCECQEN